MSAGTDPVSWLMPGSLGRDGHDVFLHRGVTMLTCSHDDTLQASVDQWLISLQAANAGTVPRTKAVQAWLSCLASLWVPSSIPNH